MKKAYLSIDLDFWKDHDSPKYATQFFNKVLALDVPILCVIEHEELLDDINKSGASVLYNVDYHSDICSDNELRKTEKAEDGTWVNYVKWRKNGRYVWICPDKKECYTYEAGTCCGVSTLDPFRYKKQSAWKSTVVTQKLNTIDWRTIERVGICLSPCYVSTTTVRTVIKKLGLNKDEVSELRKTQPQFTPLKRKRGVLAKIA